MPRIVKREAKPHMSHSAYYFVSDTVLIDKDWRPADYEKIRRRLCRDYNILEADVDDVWQACLEALEKI